MPVHRTSRPLLPLERATRRWFLCLLLPLFACLILPFSVSAQTLEETRKDFLRGNYDEVIRVAEKKVSEGVSVNDWRALLIETLMTVGRYSDAHTQAQEALSSYARTIRMLLLARETALYQNDAANANLRLSEIKYLIERRPPVYPGADMLVALGDALLLMGVEPRLVLDNCYRRAEQMSPPVREAFLAGGELALDKSDFALAANTFRNGLAKFPDDPDLQAGLARAFKSSNRELMGEYLDAALTTNPRHIPSLLLLVDHLIDGERYEDAEKHLAAILKVNPNQPEAHAARAVIAHLRNEFSQEREARDAALKYYQTNPRVDHLIGLKLSQKYRFAEGAAAQRRALEFDAEYLPARRQLAEDLLRLGEDDEGWSLARTVHETDPYDVTTYNLTTLYDKMTKFRTLTNADFVVKMSAAEADLYGDRVLDLLNRAKAVLCDKYGVTLDRPTVVEIFPEQKDFAVRTFGMPGNPGYLGVCFGSVITANSPASQLPNPPNWEDVLWHEFCHVVTLNATRNRMPRWLSEGISVYEERQAHPAWGERMNLEYRDMILKGELTPLGRLSSAFLTATNNARLQFAYYESSLVVEFLIEKFGLETIKKILAELRDGKEINAAITAHTLPLPAIEKQFADYATKLAENLAPGIDLQKPPDRRSGTDRASWESSRPDNYFVRMRRAAELMEEKRWAEAQPILERLAADYAGEAKDENPLWLLAITQRQLNDTNAELATLQKLARREADFIDMFARLIEVSRARQDWQAVTNYADSLLAVNPLIALPYRAMAEAAVELGQNHPAVSAYRKMLLLDPPDPAEVHFRLAKLLHARGDARAEAKRHVLQALEEAPRYREAQRLLLQLADAPATPANASTPNGAP